MPGHNSSLLSSNTPARPGDPLDLRNSVAGEEDPGASIDLATPTGTEWSPGGSEQAAGQPPGRASGAQAPMAPGDEASAGTPGTISRPGAKLTLLSWLAWVASRLPHRRPAAHARARRVRAWRRSGSA